MKDLQGKASATTTAPPDQTLALLADVGAYPRWYPDVVRAVEVMARDPQGQPTRARATLRASVGPVNRDLELVLDVTRPPAQVKLTRVPNEPSDPERFEVTWTVQGAGGATTIDLALEAALEVPRLAPVGGVGDSMASGFVAAAVRALEDPARAA